MKKQILICLFLICSTLTMNAQWDLSSNSVLYRQTDSNQIILKSSRTDNTQEGTLTTDGWGNFAFNKKVSIGTNNVTEHQLNVCGTVRANEVRVDLIGCDFVFAKDYKLMPLPELEKFIKEHNHLPGIAPAKEMEKNGTDLGNLSSNLLKKIEELTLYILDQNKKMDQQNKMIIELRDEIKKIRKD